MTDENTDGAAPQDDKAKLGEDDLIVVVQCDVVRLIGRVKFKEVELRDDGGLRYPFVLHDAGAVLITRGVTPGALEGTVNQVKQLSIATLDYAEAPLAEIGIESASLVYTDVMLDEAGRAHMRLSYEEFLNRRASVVQHARIDGALP